VCPSFKNSQTPFNNVFAIGGWAMDDTESGGKGVDTSFFFQLHGTYF